MGFTHLRSFHAVAETGGFTRAARALSIGQPTVTTQIRELEQHYGVELFLRQGRTVQLTATGAELLAITRRLMLLTEEADELLSAHGTLKGGHLRFAAVGPFHATSIIAAFRRAYPEIGISVQLGNSWQTLSALLSLTADVAILAHAVEDARVETLDYSRHEVIVFVHRDHPWAGRETVRLAELAGQPFVLREQGSTTRLALERALAEAGLRIDPVLEIGSREGVWKAVEQGLGISAVADFEFVPHPNLWPLRIADRVIRTEYRIAFLRERRNARTIRAFIEEVRSPRAPG
jgi:aminoethylphosphonate catabolism LysR family transcriptional regulator